jgi:hypothetical protein
MARHAVRSAGPRGNLPAARDRIAKPCVLLEKKWCPGAGVLFREQSSHLARPVGQNVPLNSAAFRRRCPTDEAVVEFPIIIAEWQRNSREIVRVALDRFNGRETIDIRSWWQDRDGTYKPGRGGLTLSVAHLPALAEGLALALVEAQRLGLIEAPINNSTKDATAAERQRRRRERIRNGSSVTGAVTPP